MIMESLVRFFFVAMVAMSVLQAQEAAESKPAEALQTLTHSGAWCWFGDPRAVFHAGKHRRTYIGWVSRNGDILVGAFDPESRTLRTACLHAGLQRDDHCNPSLLVRGDGRLLVFYSRHGGRRMFLRVSKHPEDISAWGAERSLVLNVKERQYTYPNPVCLKAEKDRIYLFWRGDFWKPCMSWSDDGGKTWQKARKVIQAEGADRRNRPYVKVSSDGKDTIHLAFTDGHPRNEPLNSIYYMGYRNGAFHRADGTRIGDMESLPIRPRDADVVYDGRATGKRAWIWDVAADGNGHPVLVYAVLPSEDRHVYHYARWDGKTWQSFKVAEAGKWFPKTPEGKHEPEPHYSGGIVLDHGDPSLVYLSRNVDGVFEIEEWSADRGSKPVTAKSKADNVRPFVVRNHRAGNGPALLWMSNTGGYVHYTDYRCVLKMDRRIQPLSTALQPLDIRNAMARVADWQLAYSSRHDLRGWVQAALYAGMAAWGEASKDGKYLNALRAMGRGNAWRLGSRPYHADDHSVGWTYLALHARDRDPRMLGPLLDRFDWILANPAGTVLDWNTPRVTDRWSWCDALFMSPPVWTRLFSVTGDRKYLSFMDAEWWATTEFLFDRHEHLFFRDSRYFDKREKNGRKVFWSRGNGWVIAGLARTLQFLPHDHASRPRYEALCKEMAGKLAAIQPDDGLWRASLLDPTSFPAPETSGTGFFCFALAWGINERLLDRKTYLPVVQRAWTGLVRAVHPDGMLGWVQPIGADPRAVTEVMTELYGVGAFLLAGTEVHKLAALESVRVTVLNPIYAFRRQETVEVDWASVEAAAPGLDPEALQVLDGRTGRAILSQAVDTNTDGRTDALVFQSDFGAGEKKHFILQPLRKDIPPATSSRTTFAAFVPERKDDFAWENDCIAFRMYGPALQTTGEISSGVDVWAKRVQRPVIRKWYRHGDYHRDHGEGLDYYKVGPSRGCGGLGFLADGKLCVSKNFTAWKLIASGPVRTVFDLEYAPYTVGGTKIREVKRVTLDLGSNLNRFDVRIDTADDIALDAAMGIVRRGDSGDVSYNLKLQWVSYWEPKHPKHGSIGCGLVLPGSGGRFLDAHGHLFLVKAQKSGIFTYHAGATWSRSAIRSTRAQWNAYLEGMARRLRAPLIVRIDKGK